MLWSSSATRSCCTSESATHDLVAIVDASHRVKPGDVLELLVPLEKLHLFDVEEGKSLN